MPAQLHQVPQCPKCGCYESRVINTTYPLAGDCDIVRRRVCSICGHRWYTGQMYEFGIDVKYKFGEGWFPATAKRIDD